MKTVSEQNNENTRIPRWICRHMAGRDDQSILVQGKMGTEYADSGQWLTRNPKFSIKACKLVLCSRRPLYAHELGSSGLSQF